MSLKEDFEAAQTRAKSLSEKPSNDDLLALYSLYKQATDGDVQGERPSGFDFAAPPSTTPGRSGAGCRPTKRCRATSSSSTSSLPAEGAADD